MELCLIAIAWLFGILSGLYCKISIVLFVLGFFLFYFIRRKNRYLRLICSKRYILIFVLTYLISYVQITGLEKSFEEKYRSISEEIKVVGTILSNPVNKEYHTSYTIKVDTINGSKSYQNTKILLKVQKGKKKAEYSYGNQIVFTGEWKEAMAARNEGGFDYKQYLKTKKIYGIIETKESDIKIKKQNNGNAILKLANTMQNKIQKKANELLEKRKAGLLTALLIGSKENLEKEVQEAFRTSNLSHMLAVSGAHVSYIIMGIGFFIAKTKMSKKLGKIGTIILLVFFIFLTGQTPSVTRACIMSIYLIVASLFHKKVSILSSISISFILIVWINPYSILDVGLQLSYAGTIGIVLLFPVLKKSWNRKKQSKRKEKIKEMLLLTISANIILTPITLYHFNTISLTFLISNLLASPIMGILVILGFTTIILSFLLYPIGKLVAYPLSIFLSLFLQIANGTSKLPFSKLYMATPRLELIVLYYLILFFILRYQKKKEKKLLKQIKKITMKKIVAIVLIIMTILLLYHQIPKQLKIHFVDVGQGDSMLIRTPNEKTILIDGGGQRDSKSFDVGKNTLLPYLLKKGITKLDYILISHFDSDHVRTAC